MHDRKDPLISVAASSLAKLLNGFSELSESLTDCEKAAFQSDAEWRKDNQAFRNRIAQALGWHNPAHFQDSQLLDAIRSLRQAGEEDKAAIADAFGYPKHQMNPSADTAIMSSVGQIGGGDPVTAASPWRAEDVIRIHDEASGKPLADARLEMLERDEDPHTWIASVTEVLDPSATGQKRTWGQVTLGQTVYPSDNDPDLFVKVASAVEIPWQAGDIIEHRASWGLVWQGVVTQPSGDAPGCYEVEICEIILDPGPAFGTVTPEVGSRLALQQAMGGSNRRIAAAPPINPSAPLLVRMPLQAPDGVPVIELPEAGGDRG